MVNIHQLDDLDDLPVSMGIRKSTQVGCKREEEIRTETAPDFNTVTRRHRNLKPWQRHPREVTGETASLQEVE